MADARMIVAWVLNRLGLRWLSGVLVLASVACLLGVLLERRAAPGSGPDAALLSVTFGLVIPVLAWASAGRIFPEGISEALIPLTRFGLCRQRALLGSGATLGIALGLMGAWLGAMTAAVGNVAGDRFWLDMATCAWIGALAGAGYSTLQTLGASWGARGRAAVLLLDWGLGVGSGPLASIWPRSHLRNLLGGTPLLEFAQWHSALALVLLLSLCVALLRVRTAP